MDQERLITVLLILLFASAVIYTGQDLSDQDEAKVVEVVDGDTVKISYGDGLETVRVLGIDTPEVYSENTPSEFFMENTSENRNCLRKIGEKASNYTRNMLENEEVRVVQDPESDKRGEYGRLLAYIEHNGTDLGKVLLDKGYARVYNSSFNRREKYRELEAESRREGKGIWNKSCGVK